VSRISVALLRTLVGLTFLALTAGFVPADSASAAAPVRVLLTGDSLTQGFNGDYTWRYRLAKEFTREGVPVNFVGSRSDPYVKPGYTTAHYADPNFDSNHFARTGSTLGQQASWIRAEVAQQQPDVIVLMAGVNDMRGGATPAQTDARLVSWINNARAAKPDVKIIMSPVLDARDTRRPNLATSIKQYDALQRTTVSQMTTMQSPITMTDTPKGWNVSTLTSDDLHPTPTGETLIAQRVAETFVGIGVLHGPINIYKWTSWARQPRITVVIRSQRAVLSWDNQAISAARVWIQRAGHAASFPLTRYGTGTATTTKLVLKATYSFRVQLIRGRMATPLGPITRVVVRKPSRPAKVARVVVDAAGVHWTASTLATGYQVKFRKAGKKKWFSRRTATGLSIGAAGVTRARVWAVNSAGRSPVRVGVR
jgi:lysophospholipase L1-like esterase